MVSRYGTSWDDYLRGEYESADQLFGLDGNDTLVGLGGADSLYGGNGNDLIAPYDLDFFPYLIYIHQLDNDLIDGGEGQDTVSFYDLFGYNESKVTIDLLSGTASTGTSATATLLSIENVVGAICIENDIRGTIGDNVLVGGNNLDTILGDAGNDVIVPLGSGGGVDVIDGGPGIDRLILSQERIDASITWDGTTFHVTATNGATRQSYAVTNVEQFQFGQDGLTIRAEDLLAGSGDLDGDPYFDSNFYLATYADVRAAGVDPLVHYRTFGWREGRDPSALFDTRGYLAVNPDVAAAGIDPLDHYRNWGWREGRDPDGAFDLRRYLDANPDVLRAGIDPLRHYLSTGIWEKRPIFDAIGTAAADGFDREHYLFANPDVAAARVDPVRHFSDFGWREGRDPNAFFDTEGYLAHNPDVAAAGMNPLTHHANYGWREGRDPSVRFDTTSYLQAYPDVAQAGVNPLLHYLNYGIYEGRQAFGDDVWT